MDPTSPQLLREVATLAGCVVGSAFFSGSETALTSLPPAKLEELVDRGGTLGRSLRVWRDHPERVLSGLLIGNNIVNVAASVIAARIASHFLDSWADIAAVAGTTMLLLVGGEVLPKAFARSSNIAFLTVGMPILRPTLWLLHPMAVAFAWFARRFIRLLGADEGSGPIASESEIAYLISRGRKEGIFGQDERARMLEAVFEFDTTVVREVMVPRPDVVAVEASATVIDALETATRSGHSRLPVYTDSIDAIVGVLHVKDLLVLIPNAQDAHTRPVSELMRPPPIIVPETLPIADLLRQVQRRNTHLAVAVDEFGGTAGIITLEDIIEEIVGDVRDEFDAREPTPIRALPEGGVLVLGAVNLADLAEHLHVEWEEHTEVDTVGGLVTAELGRVPARGESCVWQGWRFEVVEATPRRVLAVRVRRDHAADPSSQTPQVAAS